MKFPVVATIFTLAGIAILCGLGMWQLERLEWKENILKRIDAEYAKDIGTAYLSPTDLKSNFDYKRGTVQGVYDYDAQILVGPRVYEKFHGHHLVTPLILDDGTALMVIRGWVPERWDPAPEADENRGQKIAVQGLLRKVLDENSFTPDNVPSENQWYHVAPAEIAKAKNLRLASDKVLYPEVIADNGEYPTPLPAKPKLPNDHFLYAMFWFSMAGILFVIYCLRFLRKSPP